MIQELHAGDRQIPASGWNEMRAAVQGITAPQQQYQSGKLNPVYITVRNMTGSDLPIYAAVKLTAAAYPDRVGDVFKDLAATNGVEMDGYTPGAVTDTIAIMQEACPADGLVKAIVSGATPVMLYATDSNEYYRYAKPIDGQTDYMACTQDVTPYRILWRKLGSGTKAGYICIGDGGGTDVFYINKGNDGTQTAAHTPTIYTKGSLHYIRFNGLYWEPDSLNEAPASSTLLQRPSGSRLVVCQIDAPNSAAECIIPYKTPESNSGAAPKFSSSDGSFFTGSRCGVKPGEHAFTDKACDYSVTFNSGVNTSSGSAGSASYEYNPQFTAIVTVDFSSTNAAGAYTDICGQEWEVIFPNASAGLSAANYPDIYPYDSVTVLVDCEGGKCYALDYPTDYEAGTVMPFYGSAPGRGWDSSIIPTPQPLIDVGLTLYQKVKTGAIL